MGAAKVEQVLARQLNLDCSAKLVAISFCCAYHLHLLNLDLLLKGSKSC